MFYRPLHEWLPSRYSQYRKLGLYRNHKVRQGKFRNNMKQKCTTKEGEHLDTPFPQYIDSWKSELMSRNATAQFIVRDILGTYDFYRNLLTLGLDADLIIVKAWHLGRISIPRYDAVRTLEESMIELNISMAMLLRVCITEKVSQWSWQRALASEKCHEAVTWAMEPGIRQRPEWYRGLDRASSFEAFQRHLHAVDHGKCPMPC